LCIENRKQRDTPAAQALMLCGLILFYVVFACAQATCRDTMHKLWTWLRALADYKKKRSADWL